MSKVEIAALVWLAWVVIMLCVVIVGQLMDWRGYNRYRGIRDFDFDGEDRL